MTVEYPDSPTVDHVDVLHGVEVPDPYRWLEDIDADQTRKWIDSQNDLTVGYLESIPERESIRRRLTEIWDYEKYGLPKFENGKYFVYRNDGLQNHFVLYGSDTLEGEPRMLLDPNAWSTDGTVALSTAEISRDASRIAYGISNAGSDWQEMKVLEVESGELLDDQLTGIKFSAAAWTKSNDSFFIARYRLPGTDSHLSEVSRFPKIYLHRLSTSELEDELVYERPDQPDWLLWPQVSDDGRYLVIGVAMGSQPRNAVFYKDLETRTEVVELVREFDAQYAFVGNDGPVFWLWTDLDAPLGRVISIDTEEPMASNWREVIPEADYPLEYVSCVGNKLFCVYLQDARSRVKVFNPDGTFDREIVLPGIGSVTGFDGRRSHKETFYAFTSFTHPTTIYRYDIESGTSTIFKRSKVRFDPDDYETKQVFCQSKDGTDFPMFVVHKKGIELDGHNPTYMTGYGGFRISQTPYFSPVSVLWLELGGVYVVANIRGGGEYGEKWHLAGTRLQKQNVFDDFIAGAEWLVANGYTSTRRLAIGGGSNGGLLVGACVTQRPELFGGAVIAQGVLDMLRFHKFTIGWAWVSDYGSAEDPEEFKALLAYSPLHNLKPAHYPATLIRTSDHDDRVWPGASLKFASAMQTAQEASAPILVSIETRQGHGAGSPTMKMIDRYADQWAFLFQNLTR